MNEFPKYDREHLLSFSTRLRKFLADDETTHVFSVMNIVSRISSREIRDKLKAIRTSIQEEGDAWWFVRVTGDDGEDVFVPSREVLDHWFNVVVFHTDMDKQQAWKQMEEHGPFCEHSFLRYAMAVVHAAKCVAALIQAERLADPN